MSTKFSAGPQSLGYLYQARYSLFALLSDGREEAALILEGLDDVAVVGGDQIKLDQLKHHISKKATLTDSSLEIWKTIRVWCQSLEENDWQPEEVTLNLITTAQAEEGSIAALLRRDKNRNEEKAYTRLLKIADESRNIALQPAFDAFKALRSTQQERLISAITIVDASPSIQNMTPLIKKRLGMATAHSSIDSLYERLEGWWFAKVVIHLMNGSNQPITQFELYEKIVSIADQLKLNSLPIDYFDAEPSEEYFTTIGEMLFEHQLKQLQLNTRRVRNAVLDYYRAFEQRSRWAREKLYIDDELIFYEKRLVQEWERYVAILQDEIAENEFESDDNCVSFGKRVLAWMENKEMPLRPSMPLGHEYVTRGSYHILADMYPPHVYWHPKFLEYLDKILASK